MLDLGKYFSFLRQLGFDSVGAVALAGPRPAALGLQAGVWHEQESLRLEWCADGLGAGEAPSPAEGGVLGWLAVSLEHRAESVQEVPCQTQRKLLGLFFLQPGNSCSLGPEAFSA